MALNDVIAIILHYFAEFGSFRGELRKSGWLAINRFSPEKCHKVHQLNTTDALRGGGASCWTSRRIVFVKWKWTMMIMMIVIVIISIIILITLEWPIEQPTSCVFYVQIVNVGMHRTGFHYLIATLVSYRQLIAVFACVRSFRPLSVVSIASMR